jgi:hypothetical protein
MVLTEKSWLTETGKPGDQQDVVGGSCEFSVFLVAAIS